MNPMLPEEYLGVKAGLEIVAADTAHILYKNMGDLTGLDIRDQLLPARALKVAAAPAVVRIVDTVAIASLQCMGFKVNLLVCNGVRVSHDLIVAGEALVQRGDFLIRQCH